jgi:hypothetical protein
MILNYKKMDGIQFVAKVSVTNETLEIQLNLLETMGSLSKSHSIKVSNIESVEVVLKPTVQTFGWRLAGTYLPAVVALGHFRRSKKQLWVFWLRGQQALVINLKSGVYNQVILGTPDANQLAKELSLAV